MRLAELNLQHIAIGGATKLITILSDGVTEAKDFNPLLLTLVNTLLHNFNWLFHHHNYVDTSTVSVLKRFTFLFLLFKCLYNEVGSDS